VKTRILFLLSLVTILTSCHGQVKQNNANIGHTVSALSKSILVIFQASNNDYWFGSDVDGLYRYNGKTITHYTTSDGLSNNRIRSIQEDKHGHIYIATLGGISKFDGQKFTTLNVIESTSPYDNWKLDSDDLWFTMTGKSGDYGPYRYDGTNLYQLQFPKHYLADGYFTQNPDKPWSPYEVYSIYKDSKGNMWFGTSNFGACRYDGQTFNWLYEDHLTNVPNGGSFGIRSITEDKEGNFWICNTTYRYTMLPDSVKEDDKVLVNYKRQPGIADLQSADGGRSIYFMSALNDNEGNLWMASYGDGVCRYNGTEARQYIITDGPKNATIYSIYKDRKGDLWLGTHEAGAYKFNGQSFEKFVPTSAQP
jgi:ligand-binding sensor domain-containing protein